MKIFRHQKEMMMIIIIIFFFFSAFQMLYISRNCENKLPWMNEYKNQLE